MVISIADSKWLKPLPIITAMLALHYPQFHITLLLDNFALHCTVLHYTTCNTLYCIAFHYRCPTGIALHASIYSYTKTYFFLLYLHNLLILSLHCTALKYTTFNCTSVTQCSTHVLTSLCV